MELFLNVYSEFAEFNDKIFAITIKGFEPATQPPLVWETSMLPQNQHNTCEGQIFKLSPIYASVIYQFPWIRWIQWKFWSI